MVNKLEVIKQIIYFARRKLINGAFVHFKWKEINPFTRKEKEIEEIRVFKFTPSNGTIGIISLHLNSNNLWEVFSIDAVWPENLDTTLINFINFILDDDVEIIKAGEPSELKLKFDFKAVVK